MLAKLAAHIKPGRSQIAMYSIGLCSERAGTSTLANQSGEPAGACFSKKKGPWTPSGYRFMVNGRSDR